MTALWIPDRQLIVPRPGWREILAAMAKGVASCAGGTKGAKACGSGKGWKAGCAPTCGGCFNGTPPTTVQAVFSSITLCTTCQTAGFGTDAKITTGVAGDVNTSFCLTYNSGLSSPTACLYTAALSALVITTYTSTNGSCTGTATARTPTIIVGFLKSGSTYFVDTSITVQGGTDSFEIFRKQVSASGGNYCTDGTYANAYSACGFVASSVAAMGTGGSVSLVMNGC